MNFNLKEVLDCVYQLSISRDKNVFNVHKLENINDIEFFSDEPKEPIEFIKKHYPIIFQTGQIHIDSPRFFSYIPAKGGAISAIGNLAVTLANTFVGTYLESVAATEIEIKCIHWFCQLFNYPIKSSGGVFLNGGSMSNLNAVCVALKNKKVIYDQKKVVYCSYATHSSVEKAVSLFDNCELKYVGFSNQIDINELEKSILDSISNGDMPTMIIGNAGTTNTGHIDDFEAMSVIAKKYNMWFHVDAAYGGSVMLIKPTLLKGIEYSDSITIDPHKWLFQPYECAVLIFKNHEKVKNIFSIHPPYLKATLKNPNVVNFTDYSLQLSREFRSFKFWFSFNIIGLEAIRGMLEQSFTIYEHFINEIEKTNWEVFKGDLTICHIYSDKVNIEEASKKLLAANFYVIPSYLGDTQTLRFCFTNYETSIEIIDELIILLKSIY